MLRIFRLAAMSLLLFAQAGLEAQTLPPHSPLRILIVSDEVNPHGLPPEDLTQPGEIAAALLATPDLRIHGPEGVLEVATDQIEDATTRLLRPFGSADAYDVLIYFAHRIPNGANAAARQEAFVNATDAFLGSGGGVIAFHHGLYRTAGKESMQALLGSEATGGVFWNEAVGQNVIAVAPGHFITTYGLGYDGTVSYQDVDVGVAPDDYPLFNNTPDERYPNSTLLAESDDIEPLFASDYDSGNHLIGYLFQQPDQAGVVAAYQPGEHQPHAFSGNNFQILLNMILFVAGGDGGWIFGDGFETGDTSAWSEN